MKELFQFADVGIRQGEQPLHDHDCAELYISVDGRAVNSFNGKNVETLPMDVYVLNEEIIHAQPLTNHYRYCIFKFNMEQLLKKSANFLPLPMFQSIFVIEPQLRKQGVNVGFMQIDPVVAEYAIKTAQLLAEEKDKKLCDTLFLSMIELICKRAKPRSKNTGTVSYGRIAEAASYIETHFYEEQDLDLLASMTHYSKRHFTRLFREYYHMSPMDYLSSIRLRNAAQLLASPGYSMTRIAEMCGFSNSSMFSKHFHSSFGISPSQYRKRLRSDLDNTQATLESAAVVEPK